MRHRRFLNPKHEFRLKKKWFDENEEIREKPKQLTCQDILNEVKDFVNDWGKMKKKKRKRRSKTMQM